MDSIYQLQFPIFHALTMMMELIMFFYILTVWGPFAGGIDPRIQGNSKFVIPLNSLIIYYTYFMFKGISINNNYLYFFIIFFSDNLFIFFFIR